MERLRRFIWYLAGRLFLLLTLLSLFTVTFYYAMNATNIYIVLKDGMAKRAQVMLGGNESYVSLCRKHWTEGKLKP